MNQFHKPLEEGWLRELVYRENGASRKADVYYHTPGGRKLRSLREVEHYIKGGRLKIENFFFKGQALGLNNPRKEIVRSSRPRASSVVRVNGSNLEYRRQTRLQTRQLRGNEPAQEQVKDSAEGEKKKSKQVASTKKKAVGKKNVKKRGGKKQRKSQRSIQMVKRK